MTIDLSKYGAKTSSAPTTSNGIDLNKYGATQIGSGVASSKSPSLSERIFADLGNRSNKVIGEINNSQGKDVVQQVRSGLNIAGEFAGGATDILTEGLKTGAEVLGVKDIIKGGIQSFLSQKNPTGKTNAETVQEVSSKYDEFAKTHPEAAKNLEALFNIGTLGLGGKTAQTGINETKALAKDTLEKVASMTAKSEQQINETILKNFEQGVKPSVVGKKTESGLQKYKDNVVSAIKTIKENQPNLAFIDDAGEEIVGKTPETIKELSESVFQTKKNIFDRYDALAKQANKKGVTVNLGNLANELDTVIKNEALKISHPETIKYATDLQARLKQFGITNKGRFTGYKKIDAETAQQVIQNYNKSLEAFYKNPTYDSASRAAIDALLVNNLRKELDGLIENATGEQYQTLKNQYGALKSIENDVIRASIRDGKRNVKGLIDFTDIFSGGQVLNGILTLNPASIASGLTQKGIAEFYKYLNSPNRAVKEMFNAVDEIPTK